MSYDFPDCSRILPRLYQGAKPPVGGLMAMHGVDLVVLCAKEYQPPAEAFAVTRVLHCPIDDSYTVSLTFAERWMVKNTASSVARALRHGSRVYVSCQQGLNRSGLVMGLVVREMLGCSGREARQWIQTRRYRALSNPLFVATLDALPPPSGRGARLHERA